MEMQYLVNWNEDNTTKLTDRVVQLGLVPKRDVEVINRKLSYGKYKAILIHPDKQKFKVHIMRLSKCLSRETLNFRGRYPLIRRTDRTNIYTNNDFQEFGDQVIHIYFEQHPYETWGIRPDLELV